MPLRWSGFWNYALFSGRDFSKACSFHTGTILFFTLFVFHHCTVHCIRNLRGEVPLDLLQLFVKGKRFMSQTRSVVLASLPRTLILFYHDLACRSESVTAARSPGHSPCFCSWINSEGSSSPPDEFQ